MIIFLILTFFIPNKVTASTCQTQILSLNLKEYELENLTSLDNAEITYVTADDPRYNDLRRSGNNLRLNADAAYITLPRSANEVVTILKTSLHQGLRPTIRSGGHCYLDAWTNNTGGVLIDLSNMNRIYPSPTGQTIWVEPGVTLAQLYNVLHKDYDLAFPGGACVDLGVGGHVPGGGYGYLARKFGLTIDYLDSIEMVHVNEHKHVQVVQVGRNSTKEADRNLFWAIRGGGQQNFGVITKLGFKNLPRSPPVVYKYEGNFILNEDMNKWMLFDYLDKFVKFFIANSSVDSKYCDMAFAGSTVGRTAVDGKAKLQVSLIVVGEMQKLAEEYIQITALNRSKFTCDQMSFYRLQSQIAAYRVDVNRGGDYYVQRSAYMVGPMPEHQKEAIWTYMTDPNYAFVTDGWIQMRGYGCTVSRVAENETAYPHRKAMIKIQYGTWWHDKETSDKQWTWSREFYKAMYGEKGPRPDKVMDGCFMNYPDAELTDWQHLYFKDNYERLTHVKEQWDPLNIFHHRQSIELPKK